MEDSQNNGQEITAQPIENIVRIEDGRMFTSSLIIAQAFEKEHKNVLQAINNLECSEQFNRLNFQPVEYIDAKGELRPAYELTRDGFAFLAMGFTGKKAAIWKEKFLEAFNAMERKLLPHVDAQRQMKEDTTDYTSGKKAAMIILRGFASYWAYVDKMPKCVAERILCRQMGIENLEEIASSDISWEQVGKSLEYVMDICNRPMGERQTVRNRDEELEILKNILAACGCWKFTRGMDFDEYFQKITGVKPDKITKLCIQDAEKLIAAAGCILHRVYQYNVDLC